jgi:hypothetical protein
MTSHKKAIIARSLPATTPTADNNNATKKGQLPSIASSFIIIFYHLDREQRGGANHTFNL